MAELQELLGLMTEIVSAQVSNSAVAPDQLPTLIQHVFNTLASVEHTTTVPPKAEPAVPIKKSIFKDHVVCLDCGKHFSMIKRHLMTDHKLTVQQYRQKWGLPASYQMVAPDYAKVRSALAKKIGLGRKSAAAPSKIGTKTARKATVRR
jgi:predicted transcriptional regulator